ncbi:hypothetical protein Desor_3571 [Desulfosporosinus orientis DSM 765]|uniref:Cytochrome c-552/4 domain-containing protein n=1 Tax=Desulfosporosinus orientis (strain ATCC 19365 / DSM 765 / NCIMB 8382 / VKM B-1628 / Singapore I) TaxID=768706 RepID=G7WIH8_DESOD|nr:cytochrome c3 family protein [Desulfosporosinus orientis]AET69052.1 hypothetical protein Desor_3571 [Desulfosporosinus orientis DSM 765]
MKKAFLLASLFLLLMVLLNLKQGNTPEWTYYQEEYFKDQISRLQLELGLTSDVNEQKKIQGEILSFQNRKPEIENLVLPNGEVERCQTCHLGIEEISESHPSDSFGCAVCHGGNPLSLDKDTAHGQMYGSWHPGSLDAVSLSCGGTGPNGAACHSGNHDLVDNQADTVKFSIMSTKAGELSVVRKIFGIDKTNQVPGLQKGEKAMDYPNPLPGRANEGIFQENCLSQCHQSGGELLLTADKHLDSAQGTFLGNGCEACHVLTNPTHTYVGNDTTIKDNAGGHGMIHRLTTQIPYTQCNQCHNQGTHDPLKMEFTVRADIDNVNRDWQAGDLTWKDRVRDYYLPGEVFARCEVSLDCLDCHTRLDTMGDGELYTSQYDAVHIQCQDCHGTKENPPLTKKMETSEELALLTQKQVSNPNYPTLTRGDEILVTTKGEELPYLRHEGSQWNLYSRITGKTFRTPLVKGSDCEQDPGDQSADSCHKCHNRTAENP